MRSANHWTHRPAPWLFLADAFIFFTWGPGGTAYHGCGKIQSMAKSSAGQFEVPCPCCGALLKVDVDSKAVIAHTPKAVPKTFDDIEAAARAMKEHDSRKESIFRQSVEAQKNSADLLEKKFQEAVRKAKETPDTGKPLRDFDLD
jgi:phage terminase large subunit GpA-like protein